MSSFYDIIDLANETGDRIIVHDRYGQSDVAVVPLREYRRLMRKQGDSYVSVADMSGDELIDKINRELSAWKAQQEIDICDERGDIMEEELADCPPEDPFAEDFSHEPSWHKIGELLKEHDTVISDERVSANAETTIVMPVPAMSDAPVYNPIPQVSNVSETPLKIDDDEPVFYEEPI